MTIDYYNKPKDSLDILLEKYNPNKMFLIIEDVLADPLGYELVLQQLIDIMKLGFEIEQIRHRKIKFKFHKDDKEYQTMQINNFISNLICWYAFMDMDRADVLNKDYIIDFSTPNTVMLVVNFLEEKAFPLFEGDFHSKNKLCDEIFHNIRAISNAFCLLMGMSISMYDIWQAEKQCPEITDIIFGKIDPDLQPVEIEQELSRRADRLIELFTEIDCDLKPLLVSGKNISKGQFKEMFVKIGLKSDINGNTIPYLLDTNLVVGGLSKPSYQYIEAGSARKSLILQKQSMGEPGAFSKRINMLATSPSYLRHDFETCNSVGGIEYEIKNETWLKLLDNRNYYKPNGELAHLNYKKDRHLIGKVVKFTSPCTCNSKDGICKKCYGDLFDINQDLFSVGSYAATKASEPLGQKVLSSKHYQGTDSSTISFPPEFEEIFELNSTEISLSDNPQNDDELFILLDNVEVEKNDDKDYYFTKSFKMVDRKGKVVYTISEDNDSNLYLSDRLSRYYRKMKNPLMPIPLDDVTDDEDSTVFQVEIKNKELTGPIKMIEKVLNKENTSNHTLSEICQELAETFIDIGITDNLVHLEAIIKGLIRKKSNILEYPDWSRNGDLDDVCVIPVSNGLKSNPSALVSLSYGYLRQQLISPELYEKTAPSHLDALFVRNLNEYVND